MEGPVEHVRLDIPDERIDWRTKGFWRPGPPIGVAEFAAARPSLFGGDFTWPVMVARRTALERNIATLADFTRMYGLAFAPHGKTSMAPKLFQAQFDAGAWAITAATANQVLAYRRFGVPRVLLANELLDPVALGWVADELDRDPGFEFLCYADSPATVHRAAETMAARPRSRPLRILVELGFPGGRTGCRTPDAVLDVARAVAAAPGLEPAGVSGYEGGLTTEAQVRGLIRRLSEAAGRLRDEGLVHGPPIVSAGGSSWFDIVADELGGRTDIHAVLRSGSYVAHDDGLYRDSSPFARAGAPDPLTPALEIWAQVTSVPEKRLAILTMGRREVNTDAGLPVARTLRRRGGETQDASGAEVVRVDDHHAYLRTPGGLRPEPGDLVSFGISHPCTAFDHWQYIPVVEDDHTVTDVLRTYF
ncbi:alanine racemase [Nocardiopsis sediminis]|uniref:Alanine racemase n=1 Tax=Nocardiopsis sediminis TaxID=1778267 RepID=A0ABV8FJ32_9ACTN